MCPFNPCPMTIGVLERLGIVALACSEQCLHPLSWLQGQGVPGLSGARGSAGTCLTIRLRELDLDDRFPFGIVSRRPARTGVTLGAGHRFGFPINGEVREVIAGLRLIPVILEGGTDQVHSIASPTLDDVGPLDIARSDQVLIGWDVSLC